MKIALVTGSSKGIGAAIAKSLAVKGYEVIIHCRKSKDEAEAVVKAINDQGGKTHLVFGDLGKEKEVKHIFQEIKTFTSKIDLLVNNVGFDYGYLIEEYTLDQMRQIVDDVLFSKIATTKYALDFLKQSEYPVIINIASRMGGPTTIETIGAYGPAEAGVIKFTQCCALEFKKYHIRVCCVAPGLTETTMSKRISPDPKFWEAKATANPRGRVGKPQDVANVVAFLASKEADYINGTHILVTGGSELC